MKKLLFTLLLLPLLGMQQANAQCQADFVQDSAACPNVSFIDQSTSNLSIVGWYWDFGDGGTSNAQNPSYTYSADGTYTVCLTTVSADSCASTFCSTVVVNCIGGGGGGGCQAAFMQDSAACPNVSFIDQSVSTFAIVEWYWDFGDGGTSNAQNPSYTYSADGTYNVCLTTVSADSCVSTICTTVVIGCIGGGGGSGCQAAFVQDSAACPNVSFIDQSTSNFAIVEWYWDFGDGNTSNAQNPSYTYSADGNYTVCLTTVSADSCASTTCSVVNINCLGGGGGCQASFTTTAYSDSTGGTIFYVINNSTAGAGTYYFWDFGDGSTSTDQYPTHSYTADGTYTLCLTVGDSLGCTDTYCEDVVVTGSSNGFTLVAKTSGSAGLEDQELLSGLQLYPNPTSHNLTLNINSVESSEIQVAIVNIAGQVVSQSSHYVNEGRNELKLYTEDLMKGYYFVKISSANANNVEAIRFIKN